MKSKGRWKYFILFLGALMLTFALGATMKVTAEAASEKDVVTLNANEIKNWEVGKEGPFKVYVNGVQVDRTTMIWDSSNPSVATCANGKLIGKSAGTTNITCTKENGTTATCKVTVVGGKDIVTLNTTEIKKWEVGQSGPFKVYVNGVQVDRTTMIWDSSNPSVATCVNGKLVGKSAGTTTITCTKTNGTTASCKVTVVSGKDVVTLNTTEIKNWEVGQSGPFKVYVNGVQVDRTTMIWDSSSPSVATCVNGKLVGKSAGTTTITCTKTNGTTASCKVTVVKGKDVVTLNASEIKNWEVGQEGPFKAYVNGVQVDRTTMTWNSSNPSVATCVNGKLVGKSAGTTTITCTKTNGTTASCKVTVVRGKDVVTLNTTEIKNWEVGQSGAFKVYVNGVQADRTTMTWNSSNPSVATCVNGKLVGKSAGTTTITCTKANGTTASCKVTVVRGEDVVTLNAKEIKNWEVGQSGTFKVYVNGVQADRTTMTWNSSNPSVATCVNGRLVGKSAGTTIITCTKANGTTASCKVTVNAPVIDPDEIPKLGTLPEVEVINGYLNTQFLKSEKEVNQSFLKYVMEGYETVILYAEDISMLHTAEEYIWLYPVVKNAEVRYVRKYLNGYVMCIDVVNGYRIDSEHIYAILTGDVSYLSEKELAAYNALLDITKKLNLNGKNDIDKIVEIHDYLLLNVAYDEEHLALGNNWDAHYVEGTVLQGKAVCSGYASTFRLLLMLQGINCEYVENAVHAWNLVELDGEWYHVDVTWDDPIPDEEGRVLYSHFMMTDEVLNQLESHDNWKCECNETHLCDDDRYMIYPYREYICENTDEVRNIMLEQYENEEWSIVYPVAGEVTYTKVFDVLHSLGVLTYRYYPEQKIGDYYLMRILPD